MNFNQYITPDDICCDNETICPRCNCIYMTALPHTGSWSVPICRCGPKDPGID